MIDTSDDKFYLGLTDAQRQLMLENVFNGKISANFLAKDYKVWHGNIQHCPQCEKVRVTSCCACGCGICYTCGYRFSCNQPKWKSNLSDVFISPEALEDIRNWDKNL